MECCTMFSFLFGQIELEGPVAEMFPPGLPRWGCLRRRICQLDWIGS